MKRSCLTSENKTNQNPVHHILCLNEVTRATTSNPE